jgi:hypothetical protein
MRLDGPVPNHFTGLSVGPPLGDPRLDLRDLYVFSVPTDPTRTVLVLTAAPQAGALHPDAVYRLAIDFNGDLRNDIAFSFVYSEPVDGRQKVDVYLAVGNEASAVAAVGSRIFGDLEVSVGDPPTSVSSGGFSFFAGVRSDPSFVDLDGTGRDSHAAANVIAMVLELPTGYLSASPDVRIWGRCSLRRDGTWFHADRAGHPSLGGFLTSDDTTAEYNAGEPNRDRERWMGPLIEVMARFGGYSWEEAIAAINAEGTLPDVLTFDPSRPAKYPNGRTLTDDVIDYRLGFLTKGASRPSGLRPHADLLPEFPYLGAPH